MTKEELLTPEKDVRPIKINKKDLLLSLIVEKPIVSAQVDYWSEAKRGVKVHFGDNLEGFIPESECTIEALKFKNDDDVPVQILYMAGKQVTAQVERYDSQTNTLILSRKASMQEARKLISEGEQIKGRVINVTQRSIFVDCGSGNIGRISSRDFSMTNFENLKDSEYEFGDQISVKVLKITDERIVLSKKELYPSYYSMKNQFQKGQKVDVIVASKFTDSDKKDNYRYSYFVEIEPNVTGMINTNKPLKLGEVVKAEIVAVKRRGLKLRY